MAANPQLQRFRFYNDDATEDVSTALAAQNTNITASIAGGDALPVIRVSAQETGGTTMAAGNWRLRYSKNGAAYVAITTTSAFIQIANSPNLVNATTPTERLVGGTGTFNGRVVNNANVAIVGLPANAHNELVFPLRVLQSTNADGDTFDIQVQYAAADLAGGYAVTPRITVSSGTSATGNAAGVTDAASVPAATGTGGGTASPSGVTGAASAAAATATGTAATSAAGVTVAATAPNASGAGAGSGAAAGPTLVATVPAATASGGGGVTGAAAGTTSVASAATAQANASASANTAGVTAGVSSPSATATVQKDATAVAAGVSVLIRLPQAVASAIQLVPPPRRIFTGGAPLRTFSSKYATNRTFDGRTQRGL